MSRVTINGNELRCLNCGDSYAMSLPCPLDLMIAMSDAYSKSHERCEPSQRGADRMKATTPHEWLKSWDTGISSKTIFSVMTGTMMDHYSVPWDPADFGRCYRLLKLFPEWRARLPEVAKRFPEWKKLVERWDELTKLYENELPTGECPVLYAAMQECI